MILENVRSATDWIRHEAGGSANDVARLDAPPEDVTTRSWEALSDYAAGERLFRDGHRDDAVNALRAALQKDPRFAIADALLGDIEITSYHSEAGYAAYERALDSDALIRLSLRERDLIKGLVAHDNADYEAAEARPSARILDVLLTSSNLDPSRAGAVSQMIGANLVMGNLPEASGLLDRMQHNFSRDYFLDAKGPTQFVAGDYEGAYTSLKELANSRDKIFAQAGTQRLAELLSERGEYKAANAVLTEWLRDSPRSPALLLDRAKNEGSLGDYEACRNDIVASLSMDDSPLAVLFASALIGPLIASARRSQTLPLRTLLKSLPSRTPRVLPDLYSISPASGCEVKSYWPTITCDPQSISSVMRMPLTHPSTPASISLAHWSWEPHENSTRRKLTQCVTKPRQPILATGIR